MPMPVFAGQAITTAMLNDMRMKMVVQTENQEVEGTALVPSEIIVPVQSGATYWFQTVITYSADHDPQHNDLDAGGFRWNWDVPTGTAMPRQTVAYNLFDTTNTALNDGGRVIVRSPAASTHMRARGTGPDDFLSVHEYGTIQVGGQSGDCTLQFAQWGSHSTPTVLRGILRTRCMYMRVL